MNPISARQAAAAVFRPVDSPNVAWRHQAENDSCSTPSFVADGHVVASDGEHLLYLEADGSRCWDRPTGGWTPFRPAARPSGGALWAPEGGALHAYDAAGNKPWIFGHGMQMASIQPAVAPNGDVFVCMRDAERRAPCLLRLSAAGDEIWRAPLPMHASAPPLPDGTGGAIVRCDDDRVIHLDGNGREVWNRPLPERLNGRPALAPDRSVWIGNDCGQLFRIGSEGEARAVFQADGQLRGAPAFDGDRAYVTSMDRRLYALDLQGREIWRHDVGEFLEDGAVVLPDGTVVVAGFEGAIHALTRSGQLAWTERVGRSPSALVTDGRGTVVLGARAQVVALRPGAALETLERHAPLEEPPAITHEDGWIVVDNVRVPRRGGPSVKR
ncbi:MAG: hypothetical protein FJX76_24565 [Armatimonadetes bacterium]|nr:hypothetical protein [Armatimonadota bacterium]